MRNLYIAVVSVTKMVRITLREYIDLIGLFLASLPGKNTKMDPVCNSSVHVILNKYFCNISAKYREKSLSTLKCHFCASDA